MTPKATTTLEWFFVVPVNCERKNLNRHNRTVAQCSIWAITRGRAGPAARSSELVWTYDYDEAHSSSDRWNAHFAKLREQACPCKRRAVQRAFGSQSGELMQIGESVSMLIDAASCEGATSG